MKWSKERIRERYDAAAEFFAELEEGQPEIVDAGWMLGLLTEAAARSCPKASAMLDLGCGAGLYSLKMLERLPSLSVTLCDLSEEMLKIAAEKVREHPISLATEISSELSDVLKRHHPLSPEPKPFVSTLHGDLCEIDLGKECYDIVLAGAVLHHLREDSEWEAVFEKLYACLRPGGSIWIADVVFCSNPKLQEMMWEIYASYLTEIGDEEFSRTTLEFIEQEDSPRPLLYQLDLLKQVGFKEVEVLHANMCFAAFGAQKL